MTDDVFFQDFKFCCNSLKNLVTLDSNKKAGQIYVYDPMVREFSVTVIGREDLIGVIDFCPYCGTKLPKSLADEHYETIRKELGEQYLRGVNDPYDEFVGRLPQEFQTDEWWKKRGL
ncbi:MAG: hypothetical protein LBR89_04860 [Holosporales bacterium]|jgi:hypothetical protein|nr:hypothetical protein [Holosporales bacterium]